MAYKILSYSYTHASYAIGDADTPSVPAMQVSTNIMGCCGLGTISGFNLYMWNGLGGNDLFRKKAQWLENFYQYYGASPGHFVYTLTDVQLGLRAPAYGLKQLPPPMHTLFLELGAKEIVTFPNLTHGPNTLHMFLVNIRNAIGPYLDKHGEALQEPPKVEIVEVPMEKVPALKPLIKTPRKPRATKAPTV